MSNPSVQRTTFVQALVIGLSPRASSPSHSSHDPGKALHAACRDLREPLYVMSHFARAHSLVLRDQNFHGFCSVNVLL
jgi:hypothetical protein